MIFGDFNFDILLTVLDAFNFLWSIFWGELPHTKGVYILDFFCCINHFNSKRRMKHLALFVVGAAFLRPTRCKQNSRIFFRRLFGVSSKCLRKSVYEPNFPWFLVISTLIFCSLCLMFLIFCGPFFFGGLPHTKGVCILNIFHRISHFNSKWRMKHLALFVVGAAFLRPTRCKRNSRIFFGGLFGVSSKCLRKSVYEPNFPWFLVISTLIFCSLCLMLLIFCGPFFLGGLPHTKGVCILNIFYRISHFDTKWKK